MSSPLARCFKPWHRKCPDGSPGTGVTGSVSRGVPDPVSSVEHAKIRGADQQNQGSQGFGVSMVMGSRFRSRPWTELQREVGNIEPLLTKWASSLKGGGNRLEDPITVVW